MSMPRVFVNGGKRGFMVEMDPAELRRLLFVTEPATKLLGAIGTVLGTVLLLRYTFET